VVGAPVAVVASVMSCPRCLRPTPAAADPTVAAPADGACEGHPRPRSRRCARPFTRAASSPPRRRPRIPPSRRSAPRGSSP